MAFLRLTLFILTDSGKVEFGKKTLSGLICTDFGNDRFVKRRIRGFAFGNEVSA